MKLRMILSCTAVVVLLGLIVGTVSAETMTFRDGIDDCNHLMRQIVAVGESSSGETSAVGVAGTGNPLRSISSFDISAIQAGATIESVTFQFNAGGSEGSFNKAIELHKITKTDTIVVTGADGDPTNWAKITPTVAWTTPGGDYDATVMSSIGPGPYSTGANYTFDSSAAFVASAQDALDDGRPLQFILRSAAQETLNSRAFLRVRSDQQTSSNYRPLLTVDYTPVPEPGTWMLLVSAFGLLGLVAARRRRS